MNKEKAEIFNRRFTSMFTKEFATIPEFKKASESSIRTFSFTVDMVKKTLKLLKPYELAEVHELPPKVLNELSEELPLLFFSHI